MECWINVNLGKVEAFELEVRPMVIWHVEISKSVGCAGTRPYYDVRPYARVVLRRRGGSSDIFSSQAYKKWVLSQAFSSQSSLQSIAMGRSKRSALFPVCLRFPYLCFLQCLGFLSNGFQDTLLRLGFLSSPEVLNTPCSDLGFCLPLGFSSVLSSLDPF